MKLQSTFQSTNKETLLYACKIGQPDYMEEILYQCKGYVNTDEIMNKGKAWAKDNGYDRLRISVIDLSVKPDFIKAIKLVILFILLSFNLQAQTVVKMDAKGNYTAVAKSTAKGQSKAVLTGKTCTLKGVTYPVYESAKGKLFIIRTSAKTGNTYNQYLKLN